jgi:methyl-accepting chemotaxis protein
MRISLVTKLVLGILIVSLTTYGTSALFIFQLKPVIAPGMDEWAYIAGVLALGIGWTVFLGWIAARYIIRPLLRLTGTVVTVASGNLSVSIPEYRAQDEIGNLHRSFEVMLGNLRQMIADVSNSARLTDQNIHALDTAIRHAASKIETITETLERMADSASSQAESARRMLDTAERSALTSRQMNNRADRAIHLTEAMVETIADGIAKIHSLLDGLASFAASTDSTQRIVRRLEEQAEEIGTISRLVGEIADQTHLLALNASIEASHAGEHGLGFAVVAEQIRKLASDSAKAGEHIHHIVSEIQQQTKTVVSETAKQADILAKEKETGDQVRHSLTQVTASVDETADALKNITAHIADQTQQINHTLEMAKAIAEAAAAISEGNARIYSAAQEQTAVMEEISASSEQLRADADSLKRKAVAFEL